MGEMRKRKPMGDKWKIRSFRAHVRRASVGRIVVLAGLILGGTGLIAATPSAGSPSPSTAVATSITVWASAGPTYGWPSQLTQAFTKETGIKVSFQQFPENAYQQKVVLAQETHSNAFAVYEDSAGPFNVSRHVTLHAAVPLNSLLANKNDTPASYNYADFPTNEVNGCKANPLSKTVYCIPIQYDLPMLNYNQALFAASGITSPPQNWAQVVADAKILTAHGHAGMCMRGSEAQYNFFNGTLMMPYFMAQSPSDQAVYISKNWKPKFLTPGALTWATVYQTLMHDYAPAGIGAMGYTDCVHLFQTGQVGMFFDDSALTPFLYNKSVSKVAASARMEELPCPKSTPGCIVEYTWGVYLNPYASAAQQAAGWKFILWLTSEKTQIQGLKVDIYNPTMASRTSTLKAAGVLYKAHIPPAYLAALSYGLSHAISDPDPPTAASSAMDNDEAIVLSTLTSGSATPASAVATLQKEIILIENQNGLP